MKNDTQPKGKKGARRARRRQNGLALTAGVAPLPSRDQFSRTLQLLRAALRLWEAKNEHLRTVRVWRRDFVGAEKVSSPVDG